MILKIWVNKNASFSYEHFRPRRTEIHHAFLNHCQQIAKKSQSGSFQNADKIFSFRDKRVMSIIVIVKDNYGPLFYPKS